MEVPRAGYGIGMRIRTSVVVVLCLALSACLSESGLRDEIDQATQALDDLVDAIEDEGPIRAAADRTRETVDEAQAALEAFREDPGAETRQALESAERRLEDARETLFGLLDRAPEAVRESLGDAIAALDRIHREIRQDLDE